MYVGVLPRRLREDTGRVLVRLVLTGTTLVIFGVAGSLVHTPLVPALRVALGSTLNQVGTAEARGSYPHPIYWSRLSTRIIKSAARSSATSDS